MLHYMAPELIRRESTDERIDIFGFGVMAFELLTDRLPYGGGNSLAQMTHKINVDPIDPAIANPRLSEELCAILRKTLARKPEDRWPKMSTLAEALRNVNPRREGHSEKHAEEKSDTPERKSVGVEEKPGDLEQKPFEFEAILDEILNKPQ
jgi:serine/threonine protein kinase